MANDEKNDSNQNSQLTLNDSAREHNTSFNEEENDTYSSEMKFGSCPRREEANAAENDSLRLSNRADYRESMKDEGNKQNYLLNLSDLHSSTQFKSEKGSSMLVLAAQQAENERQPFSMPGKITYDGSSLSAED